MGVCIASGRSRAVGSFKVPSYKFRVLSSARRRRVPNLDTRLIWLKPLRGAELGTLNLELGTQKSPRSEFQVPSLPFPSKNRIPCSLALRGDVSTATSAPPCNPPSSS